MDFSGVFLFIQALMELLSIIIFTNILVLAATVVLFFGIFKLCVVFDAFHTVASRSLERIVMSAYFDQVIVYIAIDMFYNSPFSFSLERYAMRQKTKPQRRTLLTCNRNTKHLNTIRL